MKDLFAVREKDRWTIFGNTYDRKELFKRCGANWNPMNKTWYFTSDELPPTITHMVTVMLDAADIPEIAKAIREAGEAVNGLTNLQSQPAVKEIEIEVEKIVERRVPVNFARYSRTNYMTKKRTQAYKQIQSRIEVEPKGQMVKPSYWSEVSDYLRPGQCRPVIALVGPAGNGKTTVAKAAMQAHDYEYLEIDCTEFTEPADLIGGMLIKAENGGTSSVWVDGPVTRAFKEGLGLVINEFDALNPRAALCLQSVFQDGGRDKQGRYVTTVGCPNHDRVYPKSDCPIIISLNTYGTGGSRQYVGRNTMDAASMDRLTIITTGYENEAAILRAHGYSQSIGEKLEKWANDVRGVIEGNTLKVILSNRTLIRMAQALEVYGWNWRKTVEKEFLGRFEPGVRDVLEYKAYIEPQIRERRVKTVKPDAVKPGEPISPGSTIRYVGEPESGTINAPSKPNPFNQLHKPAPKKLPPPAAPDPTPEPVSASELTF